ncbi:MAG: SPOR domain-containing protein [Methyloceanibacter sp.]
MLKRRGKGSRNWARGVFAVFWILLAGVSGVYLFSVFSDPTLGSQLVQLNPLPGGASSGETTSAVASQSSGARDQELAEIKASLRELTQQMAELSNRLSPAEESADSSQPAPSTPPAPEPPASVAAAPPPPEPAEDVKPPEPKPAQAEAPKPVETPAPEAKPVEQAAVDVKPPAPQETTPAPKPFEPPAVAVSPLEEEPAEETAEPSSDVSAPASPPPAAEEAQTPAPSPPAPAATESAALDPVALPPAANDGSTRYGIEIGIVAKQDGLRPLWREYLTNHAALVAGLQPRRVLAPDKKWRLIAGPFSSAAEAGQACALFKKASRPCEATVYAGDGL